MRCTCTSSRNKQIKKRHHKPISYTQFKNQRTFPTTHQPLAQYPMQTPIVRYFMHINFIFFFRTTCSEIKKKKPKPIILVTSPPSRTFRTILIFKYSILLESEVADALAIFAWREAAIVWEGKGILLCKTVAARLRNIFSATLFLCSHSQ